MPSPLLPIEIPSIYFVHGNRVNLPERMAKCTPDMKRATLKIKDELAARGINLFLSDMFRSHDLQLQAHNENAQKGIFSPLPGGSMHEAGRAFDLDLDALLKNHVLSLADFWEIAADNGLSPIIGAPDPSKSEAWHFDCRGSHGRVRQYYRDGKGGNNMKPYEAMAASAILAIDVKVDRFHNQNAAKIQSSLIRLGHELGPLDGSIGNKTRNALAAAGITATDETTILADLEEQLKQAFPEEFLD
jgi:D-alanyl-D-alanine carboxypeptidase